MEWNEIDGNQMNIWNESRMNESVLNGPPHTKSKYILVAAHQHYSMLYQLSKVGHVSRNIFGCRVY